MAYVKTFIMAYESCGGGGGVRHYFYEAHIFFFNFFYLFDGLQPALGKGHRDMASIIHHVTI